MQHLRMAGWYLKHNLICLKIISQTCLTRGRALAYVDHQCDPGLCEAMFGLTNQNSANRMNRE